MSGRGWARVIYIQPFTYADLPDDEAVADLLPFPDVPLDPEFEADDGLSLYSPLAHEAYCWKLDPGQATSDARLYVVREGRPWIPGKAGTTRALVLGEGTAYRFSLDAEYITDRELHSEDGGTWTHPGPPPAERYDERIFGTRIKGIVETRERYEPLRCRGFAWLHRLQRLVTPMRKMAHKYRAFVRDGTRLAALVSGISGFLIAMGRSDSAVLRHRDYWKVLKAYRDFSYLLVKVLDGRASESLRRLLCQYSNLSALVWHILYHPDFESDMLELEDDLAEEHRALIVEAGNLLGEVQPGFDYRREPTPSGDREVISNVAPDYGEAFYRGFVVPEMKRAFRKPLPKLLLTSKPLPPGSRGAGTKVLKVTRKAAMGIRSLLRIRFRAAAVTSIKDMTSLRDGMLAYFRTVDEIVSRSDDLVDATKMRDLIALKEKAIKNGHVAYHEWWKSRRATLMEHGALEAIEHERAIAPRTGPHAARIAALEREAAEHRAVAETHARKAATAGAKADDAVKRAFDIGPTIGTRALMGGLDLLDIGLQGYLGFVAARKIAEHGFQADFETLDNAGDLLKAIGGVTKASDSLIKTLGGTGRIADAIGTVAKVGKGLGIAGSVIDFAVYSRDLHDLADDLPVESPSRGEAIMWARVVVGAGKAAGMAGAFFSLFGVGALPGAVLGLIGGGLQFAGGLAEEILGMHASTEDAYKALRSRFLDEMDHFTSRGAALGANELRGPEHETLRSLYPDYGDPDPAVFEALGVPSPGKMSVGG